MRLRKREGVGIVLFIGIVAAIGLFRVPVPPRHYSAPRQQPSPTAQKTVPHSASSVFIPYWSTDVPQTGYESLYYFGLGVDEQGNKIHDLSENRQTIMEQIPSSQKFLTVRLLQDSVIESVLTSFEVQSATVRTTLEAIENGHYRGAVLDLEKSYSFRNDTKIRISKFVHYFCSALRKNYKDCYVLVYGDTFYRDRPYDIAEIAKSSDKIIVMAYDFHKAGGEPGHNYPFPQFKSMIADFIKVVPADKLEIALGLYGYDWTLNDQGTPLKQAVPRSLLSIQENITGEWKQTIFKQTHDPVSGEKSLWYTDMDGRKHVVWYEDKESARIKTNYLLEQGIGKTSFWAWGYF